MFFEETEDSIFYREQAVFLIFVSFFRCNFYLGSNPNLLVWVSLVASLTSLFTGGHGGHTPGPGPRSWGAAPTSLMKHTLHPVGEIGGPLRHPPPRSGWRWCSRDPAGRPSVKLKAEPTLSLGFGSHRGRRRTGPVEASGTPGDPPSVPEARRGGPRAAPGDRLQGDACGCHSDASPGPPRGQCGGARPPQQSGWFGSSPF